MLGTTRMMNAFVVALLIGAFLAERIAALGMVPCCVAALLAYLTPTAPKSKHTQATGSRSGTPRSWPASQPSRARRCCPGPRRNIAPRTCVRGVACIAWLVCSRYACTYDSNASSGPHDAITYIQLCLNSPGGCRWWPSPSTPSPAPSSCTPRRCSGKGPWIDLTFLGDPCMCVCHVHMAMHTNTNATTDPQSHDTQARDGPLRRRRRRAQKRRPCAHQRAAGRLHFSAVDRALRQHLRPDHRLACPDRHPQRGVHDRCVGQQPPAFLLLAPTDTLHPTPTVPGSMGVTAAAEYLDKDPTSQVRVW